MYSLDTTVTEIMKPLWILFSSTSVVVIVENDLVLLTSRVRGWKQPWVSHRINTTGYCF